jgi:hypothetical protein
VRSRARSLRIAAFGLALGALVNACEAEPPEISVLSGFAALESSHFVPHPYFVYELGRSRRIAFPGSTRAATINAEGYRGAAVAASRPAGERRVLCLGSSEMFGWGLDDADTPPARLERRLGRRAGGGEWRAVNAAVPGHTSHEIAAAFALRWLDVGPDAIVVGDLDADARALLTQGFRPDYGHVWTVWVRPPGSGGSVKTLGGCVVRAFPGSESSRLESLAASSSDPFETNLRFLLDARRGAAACVVLPAPGGRGGALGAAVERLRNVALRVCQERSVPVVEGISRGAGDAAADDLAARLAVKLENGSRR